MSEQPFHHLFQPLDLRHKRLRNRLTFGAHTANMAEDGLPSERHRGYYEERARGGAAMIVTEPMPVHRAAVLTARNYRPCDDAVIPKFREITDAVKQQLTSANSRTMSRASRISVSLTDNIVPLLSLTIGKTYGYALVGLPRRMELAIP